MPIQGISEIRRLPRLGKIRLGVKVDSPGKSPYPKAVDYFVCPPEVEAVHGEKPKTLNIMFPVEDEAVFAQQWYRGYSMTRGLVCKGDGCKADRIIDKATGALVNRNSKDVEWRETACQGEGCPEYQSKQCRRVMNLQFLLPDVPGLGIWQLDTSSFHSIVNINSAIELIRGLCGRIRMIPLILSVEPRDVTPEGITKKTIHVLQLRSDLSLAGIRQLAHEPAVQIQAGQMPAPEPPENEERPEDLIPDEVLAKAEAEQVNRPVGQAQAVTKSGDSPDPIEELWPDDEKQGAEDTPPPMATDPQLEEIRGFLARGRRPEDDMDKT
ncbi:hypothetical protein LCGC14_0498770, partial [marine sediment metagenome]